MGQPAYFADPRNGGGYDYDCMNGEQQRYGTGGCRCGLGTCQVSVGYADTGGRTGCGTEALLVDSCAFRSTCTCTPEGTTVRRECH